MNQGVDRLPIRASLVTNPATAIRVPRQPISAAGSRWLPREFLHPIRHVSRVISPWATPAKSRSNAGECPLDIAADSGRGTVDFHLYPAPGIQATAYSRVLDCAGGCEYVFTQFSMPSAPDEVFQANVEALKEELVVLRSVLRARQVCPA